MLEGWGAAIAVGATVVGGYLQGQAEEDAQNDTNKQNALNTELGFQRQAWLDQQKRKWDLDDQKYKQDSIAGFAKFASDSAKTFNGVPTGGAAAVPTESTAGLMNFDPNMKGSIGSLSSATNATGTPTASPILRTAEDFDRAVPMFSSDPSLSAAAAGRRPEQGQTGVDPNKAMALQGLLSLGNGVGRFL